MVGVLQGPELAILPPRLHECHSAALTVTRER